MTKVNLILLGESGVGKSSLLLRFETGTFTEEVPVTNSVEFHVKKVYLEGQEITIFIWDTAGQERFSSIVRSYYRQGEGVLLVYDVTDPTTFYTLSKWLCDLRQLNDRAQVLIAGNKIEDPSRKAVAVNVVRRFADEENLEFYEMSAKSGENVEEAFLCLVKKVLIARGTLIENPPCATVNGLRATSTSGPLVPYIKKRTPGAIKLHEEPSQEIVEAKKSPCC